MKSYLIISFFFISVNSFSQNWKEVDSTWPQMEGGFMLFNDSVNDRLYIGGRKYVNGKLWELLWYYEGGSKIHRFDSAFLNDIRGYSVSSMGFYKGDLYVGGVFDTLGKNRAYSPNIAIIRNDTVVPVNSKAHYNSPTVNAFKEYKGDLIIGFSGDSLAGIASRGVIAYDGTQFKPMGGGVVDSDNSQKVRALEEYKGRLYAGGLFKDTLNGKVDYTTSDFQVWNDQMQQWERVDGWKGGHEAGITQLIHYQGSLYIMGIFRKPNAIANNIIRYDGQYFYSVGKGTGPYYIGDAVVLRNKLFVVGAFTEMDGLLANALAYFNGNAWCKPSNDSYTLFGKIHEIRNIELFRDSLFILGGFDQISGDSIRQFAYWIGDTSFSLQCAPPVLQDTLNYNLKVLEGDRKNLTIKVYPNPVNTMLKIEVERQLINSELLLYDLEGEELIWGIIKEKESELNLDWLPKGVYILQIGNETKRIIKN